MGGKAEGQMCADLGARTPIGTKGNVTLMNCVDQSHHTGQNFQWKTIIVAEDLIKLGL